MIKWCVPAAVAASIICVQPINFIVGAALGAMHIGFLGRLLISIPIAGGLGMIVGHEATAVIMHRARQRR
jgi:hypothetical protein